MGLANRGTNGVDRESGAPSTKMNLLLWSVQGLLALVFFFAGATKLVLPIEEMTKEIELPGLFLRFIGVCEVVGALGLILPGLLRIRLGLTPLAALGLVAIMIGATGLTLAVGGGVTALFPLTVGLLAAFVAYGRRHRLASRRPLRRSVLQPTG